MDKQTNQAPALPRTPARGPALLKWSRWLALLIIPVMALLSWVVMLQEGRAVSLLKERIREENRLRMQSSQEHVSDYLEEVYSILLFISQNEDVRAMRSAARGFVQNLYDHGWANHQLTEVYVVERDFRGDRRPFMTFEHEPEGLSSTKTHIPSREQDEYRTQMSQIQRFAAEPALRALLSSEISLCEPEAGGESARGFVYSVPIRAGDRLAGIVAGMLRTRTILERLNQSHARQVAFLVNARGELVLDGNAEPGIRQWFQQRIAAQGAAGFFAQAPQGMSVGNWVALWAPARILSGEQWWVVFLYDKDEHLQRSVFAGTLGHKALAASLLVMGLALALLVYSLNKRMAEQARHLDERKQLQRQVQEVSEREQRRIGQNLHEDLCQRLTGVVAMSAVLEKRLSVKSLPEAQVASEISAEIKASFTCAREMADELQPVSLLEAGLLAALEELAQRTEARGTLTCRVEADGWPEELEPSLATHLYRIAQEALSNVIAHARATQVVIRLFADERRLTLTVADNGVGLPEAAAQASGMGLHIMRYRAELIGADLQIQAAPGKGTTVSCTCPRRHSVPSSRTT